MVLFAFAIVYRIVDIQIIQGEYWKQKAEKLSTEYREIEATRGNIFDVNGNLLATSLPYYEVAIDINAPSIPKDTFNKYIDSLSYSFASLYPEKNKKYFKNILKAARTSGDRYVVLQRNVSYNELQKIKKFPLLRKGKKGGLTFLQTNKRERPFRMLASRTIGYTRNELKVGIEGAYDSILKGISGKRLMQKVAADVWRPINDENEIDPKNGSDIYTTIDINIQDVAENALQKALVKNNASYGCAILMEVKTGEIRAIANLTRTDSMKYNEVLNYAIGHATEPGSTFKLASLLAALDDGYIDLDHKINVGNGECMYYDKKVKDSHPPESPVLTVQRIFETSSNVGVSKIITQYYTKNPQAFVNKLKTYHLHLPLGVGIPGEGKPQIKNPGDKHWSGVTLPQVSYGYESLITPLQTLTLYNAVANNGLMVKPRFVREAKSNGVVVASYPTEVLNPKIASADAINKAKRMLEGVIENGTGKGLDISEFKVAGKTGTAQIAVAGKGYGSEGNHIYQASFVGYFPADNPLYTCIVIINSPSNGIYYGGLVAGPVFKEIAQKVYSSSLEFHKEINSSKILITKTPNVIKTKAEELSNVLTQINIPKNTNGNRSWVTDTQTDSLQIQMGQSNVEVQLKKGIMPNLNGLSAKDAIYLLENNGVQVNMKGVGSVKFQSLSAGSRFYKGTSITLILG
jgi:cell division protein FtsI (penicillin-binding protein 3)